VGGTKVGNGAWGLAWVDTIMETSSRNGLQKERFERERLLQEVAGEKNMESTPINQHQ